MRHIRPVSIRRAESSVFSEELSTIFNGINTVLETVFGFVLSLLDRVEKQAPTGGSTS